MKKLMIIPLMGLLSASTYAQSAKIYAIDADNKQIVISLDSKNIPRIDENMKTYPNIKDFRVDADYSNVCYSGTLNETQELLTALVEAANGDGDSWADLISITTNTKNVFEVAVEIENEAGKYQQKYSFNPCQ